MIKRIVFDVILYLICGVTLLVAGYDLLHLEGIEDRALDRCNTHWINEFQDKCKTQGRELMPVGGWGDLNYSIPDYNIEYDD